MLEKARFKIRKFGHMVTHAIVTFDSLSAPCVMEFMNLIQRFEYNNNLISIDMQPSHSHIQIPKKSLDE